MTIKTLRLPIVLLIASLIVVGAVWVWLGAPMTFPRAPLDPNAKLHCVSYAPFRDGQSPLVAGFAVKAEQIREDLAQLAKITKCVRTYAVDAGLDHVPSLARAAGLQVLQGIWIGSNAEGNRKQIDRALQLAREYPDVISGLIVGNEVLLRGEMAGSDLAALIRQVKQKSNVPVTYADVWEFWLRHRDVYEAVDFVTIHILPYWEDFPIPARHAASHVGNIRRQMAQAFPGKDILVGETGWPSAGRMREGALPSRTNQARVLSEILALAEREKFRVNLIEAYDQPWKRQNEGTVGGYWGLFDAYTRDLKYTGKSVSDNPLWRLQLGLGLGMVLLVFALGLAGARRKAGGADVKAWLAVAVVVSASGILAGQAIEKTMVEALGLAGWLRSGALTLIGLLLPLFGAYALKAGWAMPGFDRILARRQLSADMRGEGARKWVQDGLTVLAGAACALAVMVALGFVFDPRYHDFPFASLTMAALPLAGIVLLNPAHNGTPRLAERAIAGVLAFAAIYIGFNEGIRNWQALWICAEFLVLAVTLWQARDGRTPAA